MSHFSPKNGATTFRVGFLGTPLFADRILRKLLGMPQVEVAWIISQPDRPAGRGKRLSPPPVAVTAHEFSIPLLQPVSIRREFDDVSTFIREQGPVSGAVVVAYGGLLPPQFLNLLENRCINVHASLLPRWRGAAPIHRAILAGDKETGICLMQMEEGLDTGPVFSSTPLPIGSHETTGSLHDRLCELACEVIERDICPILANERTACPQPQAGATYAHKISAAECEIRWNDSAVTIERTVLGLSPSPGAFTRFKEKRLRILDAAVISPDKQMDATPGTVIEVGGYNSVVIATGHGTLALRTVQLEGRQPAPIADFLRGHSLKGGDILGQ